MAKSSRSDTAVIKKHFIALDADGTGKISQEELKTILRDKTVDMMDREVNGVMQEMVVEGSGSVDIMKFLHMVSTRKDKDAIYQAIIYKSIKKEFNRLDQNGDGYITRTEFKRAMEQGRLTKLTDRRLDHVLSVADNNDDGRINCGEFILMMTV